MFVRVPLFRKRVVTALIGTYICGVLINDGYLYSRVYGILAVESGNKARVSIQTKGECYEIPIVSIYH